MRKLIIISAAAIAIAAVSCKKSSRQTEPAQPEFKPMELTFHSTGERFKVNTQAELIVAIAKRNKQAFDEYHDPSFSLAKKKQRVPMYSNVISSTQSLSTNLTGNIPNPAMHNYFNTSSWVGLTTYYRSVAAFDLDNTFHETDIYHLRYAPCTNQWAPLLDTASGTRTVAPGEYKRYWASAYGIDCSAGIVYDVYAELILQ